MNKNSQIEMNAAEIAAFNQKAELKFDFSNGTGILTAINAVHKEIAEIGGISKNRSSDSSNSRFKFDYRGIDDFYNTLSPIIANHNLVIIPNVVATRTMRMYSANGDATFKTLVIVTYTLFAVSDGSSVTITLAGECNDNGDKGITKALSAAQKYMFIMTFSIPTESEQGQSNYQQVNRQHQQQQFNALQKPARQAPGSPNQPNAFLDSIASDDARKVVNEYMKQYGNSLGQVLKARQIQPDQLTNRLLDQIAQEFKQFIESENVKPA